MNLIEIIVAYKKRNDSPKKSNTDFVSSIIVVMGLILKNFASKRLKFN